MKQFGKILINSFLVTGVFLLLATSCKKDSEDNNVIPTTTVTDIDGNVYHMVTIGTQVWMVENLKTTKYNDGSPIPLVTNTTAWENLNTDAYCWYNNNPLNKYIYGALYNWNAVNTGKLCPPGWHVPTQAEWEILRDFVGDETTAGGKLKETGTAHWNSPNTGATDEVGFKALPGGQRYEDGGFVYVRTSSNMWTSTKLTNTAIMGVRFYHDGTEFHMSDFHTGRGLSVRCIKN